MATRRVASRFPRNEQGSAREQRRNLDLAAGPQQLHRDLVAVATDDEINAGVPELEIAQDQVAEERRQARVAQADLARAGVELQPERRLDQRERRRARPGLRRAGDRIERRAAAAPAREAAEELGQAAQIHVGRRVEQALEHLLDGALEAVAGEPERDQRIVVRPDRAVVIRQRIVALLALRDGADAPAGEEVRTHQVVPDLGRALLRADAGEQNLAGVRAAHAARALGAVEGERIGAEIGAPERSLERVGETRRLALEPAGGLLAAHAPRAARRQALRRIDVAL